MESLLLVTWAQNQEVVTVSCLEKRTHQCCSSGEDRVRKCLWSRPRLSWPLHTQHHGAELYLWSRTWHCPAMHNHSCTHRTCARLTDVFPRPERLRQWLSSTSSRGGHSDFWSGVQNVASQGLNSRKIFWWCGAEMKQTPTSCLVKKVQTELLSSEQAECVQEAFCGSWASSAVPLFPSSGSLQN